MDKHKQATDESADTRMDLRHLRRDARTALELAVVALAPERVVDPLALAAARRVALAARPADCATVVAMLPRVVTRARSALADWQTWQEEFLDKRIPRG